MTSTALCGHVLFYVTFAGFAVLSGQALAEPSTTQAEAAHADAGPTTASAKIRVLILDGFSNHNWRLNTRLLRGLLRPTELFEVGVSTCPPANTPEWAGWRPDFGGADVVIQTCNDISQRPAPKWPEAVKAAFVEFVKAGGGAFILHSGNNAFADWPEYNDIIGLGWRPASYGTALRMSEDGTITRLPPGEGRSTGHAPRAEVLVHRLGDHPIHDGLPRTWKSPALEVYYDARGPAKDVEVLSYGLDPRFKDYWPLEWTVKYGQGRVYASSFGHVWADETETKQPVDLLAVDEQTLIKRSLQWLAKRPITVAIPSDFPRADKISLSENIPLPRD